MIKRLLYAFAIILAAIACSGKEELPEFHKDPIEKPDEPKDPEQPADSTATNPEDDGFVISDALGLIEFARKYNASAADDSTYTGATVTFAKDLTFDAAKSRNFPGIGTEERPFSGTINGKGFSIHGLTACTPLVNVLDSDGIVKDVDISKDCKFQSEGGNNFNFGAIAAVCRGAVMNCSNEADVNVTSPVGLANVHLGGIVGKAEGPNAVVSGCSAEGEVFYKCSVTKQLNNGIALGGIVGFADGATLTISDCSFTGEWVNLNTGGEKMNGALTSLGGIAGHLINGKYIIEGCSSDSPKIYAQNFNNSQGITTGVFAGGIAGVVSGKAGSGSRISNCITSTPVGAKRGMTGGITGLAENIEISECTGNSSNVSGSIGHFNGGITGDMVNSTISGCLVQAEISTTTNEGTGGIAGRMDAKSSIVGCRYYGMLNATQGVAGGIVGSDAEGSQLTGNGFGGTLNGNPLTLTQVSGTSSARMSGNYLLTPDDLKGEITVTGAVLDQNGKGIEGVVVSDGFKCTKTASDGAFELDTDLDKGHFIMLSCPSDYMIESKDGLPQFYKRISDLPRTEGKCTGVEFRLTKRSTALEEFTLIMAGDPQPRARTAGYDNIAYHSLDMANDFYNDVAGTMKNITGEKHAIILGDLVHENMSLFPDYLNGIKIMSQSGVTTWSVMGNHDNDPDGSDDITGALPFENAVGPRCWSMNLGGLHIISVDDIIMNPPVNGRLGDYGYGLTDDDWNWLKSDLSFVSKDTPIFICAHQPLFHNGSSDRTSTHNTRHGTDYAALLSSYDHVYSWAGHTHAAFNYCYPESDYRHNVEQHTCSRCTGALWINEYLCSDGTPRGYVVVSVKDGDKISWRFEPTKSQTTAAAGATPSYSLRDWDYKSGKAYYRSSPDKPLDSNYQMHVYKPGQYGDKLIYANIFLYDEKWSTPTVTIGGKSAKMTRLGDTGVTYDAAYKELNDFYINHSSRWASQKEEGEVSGAARYHTFSCPVDAATFGSDVSKAKEATVSVTDRFGVVWTTTINL